MYAVINTFSGHRYDDGELLGKVESRHRKLTRAVESLDRIQRDVKRANGASAYLPLSIIELAHETSDGWGRGMPVDSDDLWAIRDRTKDQP